MQKFIKNYFKICKKNYQKIVKIPQKIHQKKLPGLAKKKIFPIKLKISTNLFSIKIKKKKFFFGTWWKKIHKKSKISRLESMVGKSNRPKFLENTTRCTNFFFFFFIFNSEFQTKCSALGNRCAKIIFQLRVYSGYHLSKLWQLNFKPSILFTFYNSKKNKIFFKTI